MKIRSIHIYSHDGQRRDLRFKVDDEGGLPTMGVFVPETAGGAAGLRREDLGLYVHLHCLVTDGAYEEHGGSRRYEGHRAIHPC